MDENEKTELKEFIKETIKEQSTEVLRAAAINTQTIIEARLTDNTNKLRDDLDEQIAESSKAAHKFTNNINHSNFDFCQQIKDIWGKTERAVEEKQTQRTKELLKKGKELIENRMQALIIADKEGWDVALGYVADPIVKDAEQEKRLKKARREAMANKTNKEAGKNPGLSDINGGKAKKRRLDMDNMKEGVRYGRQNNGYNYNTDRRNSGFQARTCWTCGSPTHMASNCMRNSNNKNRNFRFY